MLILKWTKPSHILLNECWIIFIQLWIFNVICAVCNIEDEHDGSVSQLSIRVATKSVSSPWVWHLTSQTLISLSFSLSFFFFVVTIKGINWPCLFCLFRLYFFQVKFTVVSKKNDDRVYKKNIDKKPTDDRICNCVI